ncbi:MAG: DNA repair protein RadC [Alcaligenaceae bacterium]|nr:MAG: DNA repair protein RadC [Alcaligenaceae bacterium]
MNATHTAPPRKRRALHHPKAGEALPVYGVADSSNSFLRGLRARERATIERALAILGSWMTEDRSVFDSPDAVKHYLQLHIGCEPCEHFAVLFLDSQHRCIAFERMFTGTLTQTSVYPREVVLAALRHHAAAVVLAHNHPSGSVQPSRADEALTQTLKTALAMVDVRVLDHVIVGGTRALSMAEQGRI